MSEGSQNENWVLGVVLGLLGSVAINTGNNIQSLGLKKLGEANTKDANKVAPIETSAPRQTKRKNWNPFAKDNAKTVPLGNDSGDNGDDSTEERTKGGKPSPHTSTIWLIGTIVFVSGSLLNFASYAFAAQSMLASLESIQFVTNLLFGKFMLGATVTRTMFLGTCLTVIGTIMAVQFSSKTTLELDTEEMKQLYSNPAYISYLIIMVGLLFFLDFLYRIYDRFKAEGKPLKYTGLIMPVAFSVWSALFGTQSVVQAKVLAELLAVHSSGEENIFSSWFTYATLLLWISTVAVWLKRLNDALSRFNPLFIIPLLQVSFIFFAIISGGIFFKEFNTFTANQWLGFWCGVFIMFSGLALLTPKDTKKDDEVAKDVVELLISSSNLPIKGDPNIVRPPSTPTPTPRNERLSFQKSKGGVRKNSVTAYNEGDISAAVESTKSNKKSDMHNNTRDFPSAAVDAAVETMKGVVKDPSSLFNSSHHCTEALTSAMLTNTAEKKKKRKKRGAYLRLQQLLTEHSSSGKGEFSAEIMDLVHELGLESSLVDSENNRRQLSERNLSQRVLWELENDVENSSQPGHAEP